MTILVMCAGVIGVKTAYQLLKDGHEVVVVEQRESAGEGTSAATAELAGNDRSHRSSGIRHRAGRHDPAIMIH